MKRLVVCGGGNSAHSLIPFLKDSSFEVSVYTSKPEKWAPEIELQWHDPSGKVLDVFRGPISKASDDPAELFPQADYVVFCMPVHKYRVALHRIAPYLSREKEVFVGTLYGQGGWNWMVDEIRREFSLDNLVAFAFGLIPWICRIMEYGHRGVTYGFKERTCAAVYPDKYFKTVKEEFFDQVCYRHLHMGLVEKNDRFLSLTLSVDNQIIHTSRSFSLWKRYGGIWDSEGEVPYFYRDFDDLSASVMERLDNDYSAVREAIKARFPDRDFSNMLDYLALERYCYLSDINDIKQSFLESESLGEIKTPVVRTPEGRFSMDYNHRFFLDDIYYGVCIVKWMAEKLGLETRQIDEILRWGQSVRHESIIGEDGRLLTGGKDLSAPFKAGIPSVYGFTSIEDCLD